MHSYTKSMQDDRNKPTKLTILSRLEYLVCMLASDELSMLLVGPALAILYSLEGVLYCGILYLFLSFCRWAWMKLIWERISTTTRATTSFRAVARTVQAVRQVSANRTTSTTPTNRTTNATPVNGTTSTIPVKTINVTSIKSPSAALTGAARTASHAKPVRPTLPSETSAMGPSSFLALVGTLSYLCLVIMNL